MDDTERFERARRRVEAIKGFYLHLSIYLIVIGALVAIDLVTSSDAFWFYWPALGWGIGIAIHAVVVFIGGPFGADWEQRKIRKLMERSDAGKL
jgi:hypothetical protein